jgi:plasmid stabilization system protein ParE
VNSKRRVAYLVNITARAGHDLAVLYDEIDAGNSDAAHRWYAGLKHAILGLEDHPYSWPATHEAKRLRHILYGRKPHRVYRVIYRVIEKQKIVDVLHIRHGARSQFKTSDLT